MMVEVKQNKYMHCVTPETLKLYLYKIKLRLKERRYGIRIIQKMTYIN
jgi:hypothetical protein